MKNHPVEIEQLQREVAELNLQIETARERLGIVEADLTIEIHTEKGENGKPLFSNDQLRKAAFVKRLAADENHRTLSESLAEMEKNRLYIIAALERLRLEFKLFLLDREEEINRK